MPKKSSNAVTGRQTGWTREQLLVALRLYMRSPFGKLHQRNPEIVALAAKIGRTPSALAMKACNFASLDPTFRASERKGLSGASNADRKLWNEFAEDTEQLSATAEEATEALGVVAPDEREESLPYPQGDTDVVRTIRARRVQKFFRSAVLTSYESRCAISGLATRDLLIASHIIPWSKAVARRADPTNGICLVAHLDKAFDCGLITIDGDFRVVVSKVLLRDARTAELNCSLLEIHGRPIRMPYRLAPDAEALRYHRTHVFEKPRMVSAISA